MRLLIVCLLAGASMSLAAEQPADPRPAQAAEAEAPAAAETPAPAEVPVAETAPTPTEVADSASADEAASTETAETAAPIEPAQLTEEEEKAQDREFARAGFKPKVTNGKKKYCESIGTSGSRIGKQTQCYSPEQVRAILAKESAE